MSALDIDVMAERALSLGLKVENKEASYGVCAWISVSNDDFSVAIFSDASNHIITPRVQMNVGESPNELAVRLLKVSHDAAAAFNLIMEGFTAARSVIPFATPSTEEIPF